MDTPCVYNALYTWLHTVHNDTVTQLLRGSSHNQENLGVASGSRNVHMTRSPQRSPQLELSQQLQAWAISTRAVCKGVPRPLVSVGTATCTEVIAFWILLPQESFVVLLVDGIMFEFVHML
eukprot:373673-Amphidinium_carterae.6